MFFFFIFWYLSFKTSQNKESQWRKSLYLGSCNWMYFWFTAKWAYNQERVVSDGGRGWLIYGTAASCSILKIISTQTLKWLWKLIFITELIMASSIIQRIDKHKYIAYIILTRKSSFDLRVPYPLYKYTCILLASNLVPRARVTLSSLTSFLVPLDKGNASSGNEIA